jgi:hypothetical protein
MTKGTLAAVVLWLSIATPEVARNPLAKLPPVPRPAGASGELSTRLLVAHSVERAAVPPRPPALSPRSDHQ